MNNDHDVHCIEADESEPVTIRSAGACFFGNVMVTDVACWLTRIAAVVNSVILRIPSFFFFCIIRVKSQWHIKSSWRVSQCEPGK